MNRNPAWVVIASHAVGVMRSDPKQGLDLTGMKGMKGIRETLESSFVIPDIMPTAL